MYAVRLWSVRHARGLNAFYRGFESLLVRLHGCFEALGYERIERPVAAVEKAVKGRVVRLPHVRSMRAQFDRHVVPDELPEELAQRPLRRRARQRQLRGQARHEMRVGRGLSRQPAHSGRHRGDAQGAVRGRSAPAGPLLVAAASCGSSSRA